MCAVMYEILRFRLRGCANFGKFLVLPFFFFPQDVLPSLDCSELHVFGSPGHIWPII